MIQTNRLEDISRIEARVVRLVFKPEGQDALLLLMIKASIFASFFLHRRTFRLVSWIRANDLAMIMAHPIGASISDAVRQNDNCSLTVETRLQSCMFSGAALTVVLIHNQCPGMPSSLEALCHTRNCVRRAFGIAMFMVERDVDGAPFVVYSLNFNSRYECLLSSKSTYVL